MKAQKTAKYLLRFDDLCPTMNWRVWSKIEAALLDHKVNPILAVVPDNQDPELQFEAPVTDFWDRVRQWQARGWTIGLHGYQHRYIGERPGLVTLRKKTEFAGVPAAEQEDKLRRGMEIFSREGITPRVWIAPSNSFDATTVSLLPSFGIHVICDGYFRFPFRWPQQMTWVPQQLFGFRPAPAGAWTVCYHHNHWTAADLDEFKRNLCRSQDQISSLDKVLLTWPNEQSWSSARLCASPRLSQLWIRVQLKFWEWRHTGSNFGRSLEPVLPRAQQHNVSN